MINYLFMVLFKESDGSIPNWVVAVADKNYDRARVAYDGYKDGKMLLRWDIMDGVKILCINNGKMQLSDNLDSLMIPFDCLQGRDRAGMYAKIFETVFDFIRNQ